MATKKTVVAKKPTRVAAKKVAAPEVPPGHVVISGEDLRARHQSKSGIAVFGIGDCVLDFKNDTFPVLQPGADVLRKAIAENRLIIFVTMQSMKEQEFIRKWIEENFKIAALLDFLMLMRDDASTETPLQLKTQAANLIAKKISPESKLQVVEAYDSRQEVVEVYLNFDWPAMILDTYGCRAPRLVSANVQNDPSVIGTIGYDESSIFDAADLAEGNVQKVYGEALSIHHGFGSLMQTVFPQGSFLKTAEDFERMFNVFLQVNETAKVISRSNLHKLPESN